jgi:hypothetical protein
MEYHGMNKKKPTQRQKKLFLYKHNECQQTQNGATHRDSLAEKKEMNQARTCSIAKKAVDGLKQRE